MRNQIYLRQNNLSSKNTLWNSGIFFGNAKMILKSIKKHAPSISENCDLVLKNSKFSKKINEFSFDLKLFKKIPSLPIDKAVMEKSKIFLVTQLIVNGTMLVHGKDFLHVSQLKTIQKN